MSCDAASGVIDEKTLSFTVRTGAKPQAPRHETVSKVNIISSVVTFSFDKPRSEYNLSRIGIDFLT